MAPLAGSCFDLLGRTVQLRRRLAVGRDSEIFALADDNARVAKIYTTPAPHREAKFRAMVSNAPPDATLFCKDSFVCWPEELVTDATGLFSGFVMPRVEFAENRPLLFFCDVNSQREISSRLGWPYLIRIAINLCGVVEAVHSQGHVIGDFNESNLLVSEAAGVTLMDCDSIQVQDNAAGIRYRRMLGSLEFTAPELQDASGEVDYEVTHDHYALAVAIFMLLMDGVHPFEGIWRGGNVPPTLEANIRQGRFAYRKGGGLTPIAASQPYEVLPPFIRCFFDRCFVEGHRDPVLRPSAWDWHHALKQLDHQLRECDYDHRHIYSGHLDQCPSCVRSGARAKSQAQTLGYATASTWRKHFGPGSRIKPPRSRALFFHYENRVGQRARTSQSRVGSDLLGIAVITLLAIAVLLLMLAAPVDWGGFRQTASQSGRGLWNGTLGRFDSLGWKMQDLSAQSRAVPQGVQFNRFVMCQGVDRSQKPIGEATRFRQSDIRAKGLAAYLGYSSLPSAQTDVRVEWSSSAGSGSSALRQLPRSGPLLLRLGNNFSTGSYTFSVVAGGSVIQSESISIY